MIVIATSFRNLQTVKEFVTAISKKHRFRTPFDSEHVKGSHALLNSAWENFHSIFPSFWENLICKICPLVIYWILSLFCNTFTAKDKYPVRECENYSSRSQMQLSFKPKTFSRFFFPFLESSSNFKHFERKDDRHSYFVLDCQRLG